MQHLVYLNDDEYDVLPDWRRLTHEQQDMICYLIRRLASERPALDLPDDPNVVPFPKLRIAG